MSKGWRNFLDTVMQLLLMAIEEQGDRQRARTSSLGSFKVTLKAALVEHWCLASVGQQLIYKCKPTWVFLHKRMCRNL